MRKILTAGLLVAGTISAMPTPAFAADPLPQCATINSLNCQGTFTNIRRPDGIFIQIVNGTDQEVRMFWPFRNPVINASSAYTDPNAFPADYVTAKTLLSECNATVAEQDGRIDRLRHRVHRQRRTIRHLRAELRQLRDAQG